MQAVEFEKKLIGSTPKSVLFAALIATNLEHAITLEKQVTNLNSVASVDSITRFLSEDQTKKLTIVGEIKADLASLRFDSPDRRPVELSELSATLYSTYGYVGAAYQEVKKNEPALAQQLLSLRLAILRLRKEMLRGSPAKAQNSALTLGRFQQALFNDVRETFHAMQTQDNQAPLRAADLPPGLARPVRRNHRQAFADGLSQA